MSEEGSMPIVRANSLNVDFSDSGTGPTVVLIHSW